jgi:ankyrin repeat protein
MKMKRIKIVLTLTILIFVKISSFAGATEDLWAALKGANYANALPAISAGADMKSLDPTFGTPLNFAACWAPPEVVKALIDAGSDVNFIAPSNKYNPLMNAAQWGNPEAVKLLLAADSDIKIRNVIGQTMLACAFYGAKLDVVKLLVAAGADPSEKYKQVTLEQTLLGSLIGVHSPKEKIAYIQSVSKSLGGLGITFPDHLKNAKESDYTGLEELATYLISKGADPNQKVIGSWRNILFQSIEFGKTGAALALIKANADIEAKGMIIGGTKGKQNSYEVTPLMVASAKGDNAVVEALLALEADVNFLGVQHKGEVSSSTSGTTTTTTIANSYEYNTALSLAVDNNHPDTAELLLKKGALGPKEVMKLKKR